MRRLEQAIVKNRLENIWQKGESSQNILSELKERAKQRSCEVWLEQITEKIIGSKLVNPEPKIGETRYA